VQYLVGDKGFNEDRVRNGAARLTKNLKSAQQSRLEGFFKPVARTDEQKASLKRKQDEKLQEQRKRKKEEAKAKKDAKAKPRGAN
jgi:flap endonuclease-1